MARGVGHSAPIFVIIYVSFGGNGIMALAISNIPVLTGEVAEELSTTLMIRRKHAKTASIS